MLKLKEKSIGKLAYYCLLVIIIAGNFLYVFSPKTARASGNVYEFSNIKLTEDVQVSSSPTGPFTNSNFIRVGKDKEFYVQVTIRVASLLNRDNQSVSSFDTTNDAVYNPGFLNTNFAISGVGPSFVAKVTQQQAAAIGAKIAAGADPKTVGGIPCYKQSITSGGGALVNGVFIVGAATAVALTGGAALSAGALAVGGSAAGVAAGSAVTSASLSVAIAAESTAATVVGGAAGGAAAAKFVPVGSNDYIKCDGPVRPSAQAKGVINVGDVVFQQVITVPASSYSNLGMGNDPSQMADSTKEASTQPVNEFFVVPDVYFQSWFGIRNDFMSSIGAGKSVYVQLYNTQADADKHVNDQIPNSVPNNGSNTGSGLNVAGSGSPLMGFINQIIGAILGFLQEVIYFVFYWLIAPIIQSMLSIHTYTDAFAGVIYPGWIVVRNLSNIVFIVALIAIGMATLFRVESYQFKHLIVQLIIAALLVNFSLVIAQAILGVADTVQSQFLPNNVEVVRSLAKDMMVAYRSQIYTLDYAGRGYFSVTVQQLFWVALSLGSFAVFCAIAVFLVVRIVALWVLLMISPIAYVAGVLPTTNHYRTEWWSTFLKYAFFTPIMAFFLNMTALMIGLQKDNPVLKQIMSNPQSLGLDNFSSFVLSVTSNILLLVFLLVGLKVADKFGIYGANAITSMAEKGIYAPFALTGMGAKGAGGAALRAYTRWTTKKLEAADKSGKKFKANAWRAAQFLNFHVAKEAYEHRVKEKEEEAYEPAIGYVRDSINRIIPTEWHRDHKTGNLKLGQKTYYGRLGQAAMIAKKRSLWEKMPLSEEEKNRAKLDAHHSEELEALEYVHVDGRNEDGYMIKWMQEHGIDKQVVEKLRTQLKAQGKSDDEIAEIVKDYGMAYYDPVEYWELVANQLEESGLTKEQVGEKIAHLQEHAEGEKKQRGLGIATGEWDDQFRAIWDFSGYKKLEEQRTKEGKDGKRAMLDELSKLDIFDDSKLASEGKLLYQVKDEDGKDVGKPHEITDFKSLQTAIDETAKLHSNAYDRVNYEQSDLAYMLAGARGIGEYVKRMGRTNSEQAAQNFEPASVKRQFANGKFRGFSSKGRMSMERMPDAIINSYQQTRAVQDRSAKASGIYKDKKGNYNLDPEKGTIDYHEMGRLLKYRPTLASAIIARANFTVEQVEKILDILQSPKYNKYLKNVPVDDKGEYEIHIKAPSDRAGATIVFGAEAPHAPKK